MLEAREIVLERRGRRLLGGIDLTIAVGRVTAIIGPNGAGKSMLLRVLAGELSPTGGIVRLDGKELSTFSAAQLSRRRAVVPQSTNLSFPFTVVEVVRLGASVPGFDGVRTRAHEIADQALNTVGLANFSNRLYNELSGGEKQRVHIARALCQLDAAHRNADETTILMLDEPTSSLGHDDAARLFTRVHALKAAGLDYAAVPPRYRTPYFSHIMGGYAAAYYAYIWSEVLDANTVEWIKANGGLKPENGDRLRNTLLSRGGSKDAKQLFVDFTGHEPKIEPLLKKRGLDANPAN